MNTRYGALNKLAFLMTSIKLALKVLLALLRKFSSFPEQSLVKLNFEA